MREKAAWLASITEAINHGSAWIGEPIPSFMCHESKSITESRFPSATASDDGHSEAVELVEEGLNQSHDDVGGLPTIFSIPDVSGTNASVSENEPRSRTDPLFAPLREHVHGKSGRKKRLSTMSGGGSKCHPQPPQLDEDTSSRRSSSTSVMSIFSPIHMTSLDKEREKEREKETETILITRSSTTSRQAVDFGLQDVISATCASARAEAAWREKADVGPGTVWGSTKAKTSSNSAMGSMSRGMAMLSKHESVRIPRKRTSVTVETLNRALTKGTSSGRKTVKKLSLTSSVFNEYDKSTTSLPDEPTPATSDLSSPQSSQAVEETLSATPVSATFISVPSDDSSQTKLTRSFVQNVKDLFHFRHVTSPVSVIVSHPTQTSLQSVAYVDVLQAESKIATNANQPSHGLLKRFTKGSGRAQRVESATKGEEFDYVTITSIHDADEGFILQCR
jgi:hypothetical protein